MVRTSGAEVSMPGAAVRARQAGERQHPELTPLVLKQSLPPRLQCLSSRRPSLPHKCGSTWTPRLRLYLPAVPDSGRSQRGPFGPLERVNRHV